MLQNDHLEKVFIHQASSILEALANLTYLICEEADKPAEVRRYARMSEERIHAMTELLQFESLFDSDAPRE